MRIILLLLMLFPLPAMACTFVGGGPSSYDLYRKFSRAFRNADEIHRVRVVSLADFGSNLEILESYKTEKGLPDEYYYAPPSSCDVYLDSPGSEYVIFANWDGDRFSVFSGNAMSQENRYYERLLNRLAKKVSD